ncbi:MAG: energy transducer TonB [bacterium]|nr:energy transducer TonB [bacterium]
MLNDSPLKITILVSILIHALFLGIPADMLKFFSPEVETPKDFIAQIEIEKSLPPQKIERPESKPKFKPKKPEPVSEKVIEEPVPEPLPEEEPAIESVKMEEPQVASQPIEQETIQKVISSSVEQETIQKIDFARIAIQNYQKKVRSKIEQAKRYPVFARRNEIEGVIKVQFTILSDGRVEGIKIINSSNNKILDTAACNTIKQAAPFPPVPKEIGNDQLEMQVDIVFNLE